MVKVKNNLSGKIIGNFLVLKQTIENTIIKNINPLVEFLGAERVDDLKDKVYDLILKNVEEDLNERGEWVLDTEEIYEITNEALDEVRAKIKKKFKDAYLEVAEQAINNIRGDKNERP